MLYTLNVCYFICQLNVLEQTKKETIVWEKGSRTYKYLMILSNKFIFLTKKCVGEGLQFINFSSKCCFNIQEKIISLFLIKLNLILYISLPTPISRKKETNV